MASAADAIRTFLAATPGYEDASVAVEDGMVVIRRGAGPGVFFLEPTSAAALQPYAWAAVGLRAKLVKKGRPVRLQTLIDRWGDPAKRDDDILRPRRPIVRAPQPRPEDVARCRKAIETRLAPRFVAFRSELASAIAELPRSVERFAFVTMGDAVALQYEAREDSDVIQLRTRFPFAKVEERRATKARVRYPEVHQAAVVAELERVWREIAKPRFPRARFDIIPD